MVSERMRKTKITEWKCDRCGKTIESRNRILRPIGMGMLKIYIDNGKYSFNQYERKHELCSDCAEELIDIVNDYLRK